MASLVVPAARLSGRLDKQHCLRDLPKWPPQRSSLPIPGHSYFRTEKQKHFTDAMCQGTKHQKGRRRRSWTVVKNNSAKLTNRNKGCLTILEDTIISLKCKEARDIEKHCLLVTTRVIKFLLPYHVHDYSNN